MDTYYPTGRRREPSKKKISLPAIILTIMFLSVAILLVFFFFGGNAAENILDLFSSQEKVGDQYALEENIPEETEDAEGDENEITCPQLTPPADDFCEEGTIVSGLTDENGCPLSPRCEEESEETGETGFIICQTWNCFISASEDCSFSNFTNTATTDIFGILVTTTTYYEILGEQGNLCWFKLRTEEQHVEYSDDYIAYLLSSGTTPEEVNESLNLGNYVSDLLEDREGTCKIANSDLTVFLEKSEAGTLSGSTSCSIDPLETTCEYEGDWEFFSECEGEYFSTSAFIHDDPNCKLQVSFSSMSLLKGISSDISASGFDNANDVSWMSNNETVATVSPSVGATTKVTAEEVGSTEIVVTDNSIGPDCNISIDFEVF
jgi:hypothetical protein